MRTIGALLAAASLVTAAGCSAPVTDRVECRSGRSTLSSLDPHSGAVRWRAALGQASERPPVVAAGHVVVDAACGAAAVSLTDGAVELDAETPGALVGASADQLFTLDGGAGDVRDDRTSTDTAVAATDLVDGRSAGGFSTNLPYRDALVADGRLVVLAGDELEVVGRAGDDAARWLQVPAGRAPRLVRSGPLVLVMTGDGSTSAVDLTRGRLVWRTVPPVPATAYDLQVTSVPDTVLTAATTLDEHPRSVVWATDAGTGRVRWSRTAFAVVAADRDLSVLRAPEAVVGVDNATGAVRWRRAAPLADVHTAPPVGALADRRVVLLGSDTTTVGLDRRSGRERWRGPGATAVAGDRDVVVLEQPGLVTVLDAATGAVRWSRPTRGPHQEVAVAPDGALLLLESDTVPHLGA